VPGSPFPCQIVALRLLRKRFSLGKDEMIISNFLPFAFSRKFVLALPLLLVASAGVAQIEPSSAHRTDTGFDAVTEDWSTPALSTSHLKAIPPIFFVDDTHPGYTLNLAQVQWRRGDPIDLYVIKPKGIRKPPVILYLFSFPEDTDTFKNPVFQEAVTKNGFAAVGFVSALTGQRYHDRPMKEWFISELQESLATSAHDVQMVLNYLADRGDLDGNRVGIFGQGSGGSIAILASAADPRITVLDVLDPWGDWPTWMATSPFVPNDERPNYVTPEFLKKVQTLEPVAWLPKIQAREFRIQDAVFETKTPKAAKEKLRAAAPPGTTFAFYKTEADFNAVFQQDSVNLEWMEHELRMLPDAPATGSEQH
jgi:hypothetical protein